MRRPSTALMLAVAIAAVAPLAGCGGGSNHPAGKPTQAQLDAADAYLTLLNAQNANALAYSQAVLKTSPSGKARAFARSVLKQRQTELQRVSELEPAATVPSASTPYDAARLLGLALSELAVSGNGTPLAAPTSEQGYVSAMQANASGAIAAARAAQTQAAPAVAALARDVQAERRGELKALAALNAQ